MKIPSFAVASLATLVHAAAEPLHEAHGKRQATRSGTATVTMDSTSGTPVFLCAGVHNGIPPNGFSSYVAGTPAPTAAVQTQIPNYLFSGLKLQNARGGQANLPDPSLGWLAGEDQYENRFRAWYSTYLTVRQFDANYTLMVNNLWGQKDGPNTPSPPPALDGNWTDWDNFLTRFVSDIKDNDITDGLDVELWNEADFQFESNDQFLETWGRSYHYLRDNLPSSVRLVGPGYALPPSSSTAGDHAEFFKFVKENGSVPDAYTFHHLNDNTDPAISRPIFNKILSDLDLPSKQIYINEFGSPREQSPSFDVWFYSRFERLNQHALRANWESTEEQTSDFLANTLSKSGTTYRPNGSWQAMSYYANMTGTRVATTGSTDNKFDVYAVRGTTKKSSKIISGSHGSLNPYEIKVTGMTSAGYDSEDTATVTVKEFGWNGLDGAVDTPKVIDTLEVEISDGEMTISTKASAIGVAYAFEF